MDHSHPVVQEVGAKGFDLDDGMVLKYQGILYHGADALHLMALLGGNHGWLNRVNARLFSSKPMAKFCYPAMPRDAQYFSASKGHSEDSKS